MKKPKPPQKKPLGLSKDCDHGFKQQLQQAPTLQ